MVTIVAKRLREKETERLRRGNGEIYQGRSQARDLARGPELNIVMEGRFFPLTKHTNNGMSVWRMESVSMMGRRTSGIRQLEGVSKTMD